MRRPRPTYGEWGEGRVEDFAPPSYLLEQVKRGDINLGEYVFELDTIWSRRADLHLPGVLGYEELSAPSPPLVVVPPGATLACSCARGAPCHRLVAGRWLARAGWAIILDGELVGEETITERLQAAGAT